MDVLAQVACVLQPADVNAGRVTLTLDLDQPEHRAAYAAAVAVLHVNGIDPQTLVFPAGGSQMASTPREALPVDVSPADTRADGGDDEDEARLRRGYLEALAELTPDEDKQRTVLNDTFPRIKELLRDGANVISIAQIQYHRWVEEHLHTLRRN